MSKTFRLIVGYLICAIVSVTAAAADPVALTPKPAPALVGGTWVNGMPGTNATSRGKVRVLLFWTHGCINCKHNLGFWNDWANEYKGTDVEVISVHTPEGQWERDITGVRSFVKQRGLSFPVLIDNSNANWNAYNVQAWPTEILIDKKGTIRYQYDGELNWGGSGEYKTVHEKIDELRREG